MLRLCHGWIVEWRLTVSLICGEKNYSFEGEASLTFAMNVSNLQVEYFAHIIDFQNPEPTSGYIQAGMDLGLMSVFAAELSAQFLEGRFSLPQSRLQTADPLHVLLRQSCLTKQEEMVK